MCLKKEKGILGKKEFSFIEEMALNVQFSIKNPSLNFVIISSQPDFHFIDFDFSKPIFKNPCVVVELTFSIFLLIFYNFQTSFTDEHAPSPLT